MTGLDVEPLSGVLGATVRGVDLAALDDAEFAAIADALAQYQVLAFSDQDLTAEQQMDFGRRFGPLDTHPFVEASPDHPEVIDIITEPNDRANFGGGWHTDVTFLAEPDLGSILYAVELPPVGGDTLFASQTAAYDALSDTMKQMLEGLTARHSAAAQYGAGGYSTRSTAVANTKTSPDEFVSDHPVVRTHPVTEAKALYVNGGFTTRINGLRRDESDALLGFLLRHATKERFTCRVRWSPGMVVLWDNRCVQHHALFDYVGQRRHVRRVTVKGDRPR